MLLSTLFQESSQFLLDLLFPPSCISCKTAKVWLCQDCLSNISFITGSVCQRCGTPTSAKGMACQRCQDTPPRFIDGIRAASWFEDNPMRQAIHFLKYHNHKVVAAILGQILVETYQRYDLKADVILPVPLHTSRLKERGYNQSELLAGEISHFLNLPVDTKTLQRVRKTRSQVELGIDERFQNVANAFSCRSNRLAGQKVLLIDDVYTTGATMNACAAALSESRVASVWGLTLATAR